MNYITKVSPKEKEEIEKATRFIHHKTFDEKFCFAGNFTIAGSEEDGEKHIKNCCGEVYYNIYLSTGKRVVFCFDYGH